jgi:hypothetical protein
MKITIEKREGRLAILCDEHGNADAVPLYLLPEDAKEGEAYLVESFGKWVVIQPAEQKKL